MQETGSQLPPFNPKGSAEEQQAQVKARAWPWQQATKAYKDTYVRKRRRPTSVDVQALGARAGWSVALAEGVGKEVSQRARFPREIVVAL